MLPALLLGRGEGGLLLTQLTLSHPACADLTFMLHLLHALTFSSFLSPAFCPHSVLCEAGGIWEESLIHFLCTTMGAAVDYAGNCL